MRVPSPTDRAPGPRARNGGPPHPADLSLEESELTMLRASPLHDLFRNRRRPRGGDLRTRLRPRSRGLLNVESLESRTLLSAGELDPTFGVGGKVVTDIQGPSVEATRSLAAS